MTPADILGLWANLPRVEAIRELAARRAAGLRDHAGVYDLVLAATGDRDRAEEASKAVLHEQLKRGDIPSV